MRNLITPLWALPIVLVAAGCTESQSEDMAEPEEAMMAETKKPKKKGALTPITEAETIDAGLAVGDTVPLEAALKTSDGETNLGDIVKEGPAVLIFTRSVAWCPYCQTQLKSINTIVGDLDKRGYRLFGVSYDAPDKQDRFSMNQMLDYGLLSDEGSTVIDAFKLRDPQYTEGRAVGVPYASVYVVDKEGKVVAKSVSEDYKKRPTNDQILGIVDNI